MTVSECISNRIREILFEKQITIYKLGQISGLSKGTINSLLYNRYNSVNLKTVFIIIEALNMTILEFFNNSIFADILKINLD